MSKTRENAELQSKNVELISHLHDSDAEITATRIELREMNLECEQARGLLKDALYEIGMVST